MSPRLVLTVPAGNPERRMWMIHIYLPGDSAVAVDSFVLKSELQEHWRCPCHRHLKLLKGFFLPSNWRTFFFFCYFFLLLLFFCNRQAWNSAEDDPEWLNHLPLFLSAEIIGIYQIPRLWLEPKTPCRLDKHPPDWLVTMASGPFLTSLFCLSF